MEHHVPNMERVTVETSTKRNGRKRIESARGCTPAHTHRHTPVFAAPPQVLEDGSDVEPMGELLVEPAWQSNQIRKITASYWRVGYYSSADDEAERSKSYRCTPAIISTIV